MKAPAAAPANSKIKFSMKIRLPAAAGKALKAKLKAEIATMKATKATKAIVKDIKEGRYEGQGVLDLYIEELDLHNQGEESVEMGPSITNTGVIFKVDDWIEKIMSKIEKTFSNLSIDQDQV